MAGKSPLQPRTLVIAGLVAAVLIGAGLYAYYKVHAVAPPPPARVTPPPAPPPPAAVEPAPAIAPSPTPKAKPAPPPAPSVILLNPQVQDAVDKARAAEKLARGKAADARQAQSEAQAVARRAEQAAEQAQQQSGADPQTMAMAQMMSPGAPTYGVADGGTDSGSSFHWAGQVSKPYAYNEPDGLGVYSLSGGAQDGDRFEGEKKKDEGSWGPGIYVYKNGARYEGEFQKAFDGVGVLTGANGERYEGEFQDGARNGAGVSTVPAKNSESAGQWSGGVFSGYGVITLNNGGASMAGNFRNGLLDGPGAMFDIQGRVSQQGIYVAGKLVTPLKGN